MGKFFVLFSGLVATAAASQQYVAFDGASASSTYSAGNLAGSPAFAAQQALSAGSGYWCSSGSQAAGQSVTWTGVLNSRRTALGLKVDWAYSPGEVKILTSSDGANFEEAKCWQSSARKEVAFEETFMFDAPRSVKAVAITMRSPQSWGYFGINTATLIAEPGPFMLVSGITSVGGEQCLVTSSSGVSLEPCLEAIAAGDGREVMQFDADGQIVSMADGKCVVLADGDTSGGGKIATDACSTSIDSGDGRTVFTVTPKGQLKMPRLGNYCLTVAGEGANGANTRTIVQDCVEAESNTDARDKFFMVSVPEYDPSPASAAKVQATLLKAAQDRLGKLLAELYDVMPSLAACGFKASFAKRGPASMLVQRESSRVAAGTGSVEGAAVIPAVGVDMQALRVLVTKTREALAQIAQ